MSLASNYIQLPGSARTPLPGSRQLHAVAANEPLEVSVYLKSRSPESLAADIEQQAQSGQYLSREELAARHSADPEAIAKVVAFAHQHDLTVIKTDAY